MQVTEAELGSCLTGYFCRPVGQGAWSCLHLSLGWE